MDPRGPRGGPLPVLPVGQYYEYVVRVPFHEQSFFNLPGPVVAEDGRRAVIPISVRRYMDETIDDKLARSAPELMEESTELVESMREEHCPNSLEAEAWFLGIYAADRCAAEQRLQRYRHRPDN